MNYSEANHLDYQQSMNQTETDQNQFLRALETKQERDRFNEYYGINEEYNDVEFEKAYNESIKASSKY